ncbi:hypothetical protein IFR05_004661 [Cadophora sp. M221]|nr:hypothetical protein IFR05_004661 [Cadophora sp. M221]
MNGIRLLGLSAFDHYMMVSLTQAFARAITVQKSVFAHVVVGNTAAHEINTWAQDIGLAAAVGIDAFALNIAYPDPNIITQVSKAFTAAETSNSSFKLFFSFDYLGGGAPWPAAGENSVISYLNQYKDSQSYFWYKGKPFVSTFEGVDNVQDWKLGGTIRSAVGDLFFVPDWSSLGPLGIKEHLDKIQGAFSWNMWPEGPNDMTTNLDEEWQKALGDKSYMMGVSPWFFRSASGGKNWVWRGDNLWAHRWTQTAKVEPDFIQIVTWNDYGESHYIGPIYNQAEIPVGSAQYINDMPHDSWRDFIPYYIAKYKGTSFDIVRDQVQYWYRNSAVSGGADCGVVGNNANQGQVETSPGSLVEDRVFVSAILKEPADVYVQIGNNPPVKHSGVDGINHWNQPYDGPGEPKFSVLRNGIIVKSEKGSPISAKTKMSNGCTNYNAWVGSF